MGFAADKGSEKGSQASRRCPERHLGEYDPLGVHQRDDYSFGVS